MSNNSNKFSISTLFSNIVTSDHNQHVTFSIVGATGNGKSNAALKIAEETAVKIAKKKGGKPEDYFNIDHVAVISQDEVYRVMSLIKPYGIYILDDVAAEGWNSRDWNKRGNKSMNKIIQTFRTDNIVLIMTFPSSFLIDRVPRTLAHWYMEMDKGHFERGISIGRFFEIVIMHRMGQIHERYIKHNGSTVKRMAFQKASKELIDAYEAKRKLMGKELRERSMEEFKNIMDELKGENGNGNGNGPKITKKDAAIQFNIDYNAGVYGEMSKKKALNKFNEGSPIKVGYQTVVNYAKEAIY